MANAIGAPEFHYKGLEKDGQNSVNGWPSSGRGRLGERVGVRGAE